MAMPVDFEARYGAGLGRVLVLGGGGVFQIAWETGYLATAAGSGVDLRRADRIVGTSAGALVGAVLAARRIALLDRAADLMARVTAIVSYLAPVGDLSPSQQRAFNMMWAATDNDPATVAAIGHAAMAASTPSARSMRRNISVLVDYVWWPSRRLWVTAVDAYTANGVVITKDTGVRATRAVAASCAMPGLYAPQPVGDRRCMDGAMSGTATNSDLAAGAGRAVVLSLAPGDAPCPRTWPQRGPTTCSPRSNPCGPAEPRCSTGGHRWILRWTSWPRTPWPKGWPRDGGKPPRTSRSCANSGPSGVSVK